MDRKVKGYYDWTDFIDDPMRSTVEKHTPEEWGRFLTLGDVETATFHRRIGKPFAVLALVVTE